MFLFLFVFHIFSCFVIFSVISRFFHDHVDRWRCGFAHILLFFFNIFSCFFGIFSVISHFRRDRFDRRRYGFAYMLLLFQYIFLFLLYFWLTAAFITTISIVGGMVLHTCRCV